MSKMLIFIFLFSCCQIQAANLAQMTIEEKVGQLFMAYFNGESVNEHAGRLICEAKIGGIIYYSWSNGLADPLKVRKMSEDLQSLSLKKNGIPLFIATDQEGGIVARLHEGFTEFPGNGALGQTAKPELAYQSSFCSGHELRTVGVNFNLAPVVDVNNNSANPIIGIRSFGDEEDVVTAFGKEALEGYKEAGVIPCLKHFPGHGDVSVDSHSALPVVNKSYATLEEVELYPFKRLIKHAPVIMTAHLLFPQIDPNHCATLSSVFLQNILRESLDFQGVVITDSLMMQGVLKGHASLDEVVIKAFQAGNDIILIGGRDLQNQVDGETNINEIISAYWSLLNAVRKGEISEERLNRSVARILKLKEGILPVLPLTLLRNKEHLKIASKIAHQSLRVREWDFKGDFSKLDLAIISPTSMEEKIKVSGLMTLGKSVALNPPTIEKVDCVIFCSYNAWKDSEQLRTLQEIAKIKPTVCVALRDPYDLDIEHDSVVKIATYSPTLCSLQALCERLQKGKP